MNPEISFTKRLAPEDITPGLFVAIAAKIHDCRPQWSECIPAPTRRPCIECADGDPRIVLATCLPFVLTELADGRVETLDVRQNILVQLDEMVAVEAFTRPGRED